MSKLKFLKPKNGKEIPFLILVSFLTTFLVSRTFVYFVPSLFLTIRGVHLHHFAYGIILLSITNYFLLTGERSEKIRLRFSIIYGIALGFAFDEFVMWTELEGLYWDRTNIDAVVIVSLIFMNIIYFGGFWHKWGTRLGRFLRLISEN